MTSNEANPMNSDESINLTDQEIQIIRMICEEKTTEEIAKALNLSARTTSRYREKLLVKTGSRGVIGILKFAVYNNIYDLDD